MKFRKNIAIHQMISIEGLIGAGKSTLAQLLRESGVEGVVDEPIVNWKVGGIDILNEFIKTRKSTFSFKHLYLERASAKWNKHALLREAFSPTKSLPLRSKAWKHDASRVRGLQSCACRRRRYIGKCTGRIYVKTSVKTCMDRIKHRGRQGEGTSIKHILSF